MGASIQRGFRSRSRPRGWVRRSGTPDAAQSRMPAVLGLATAPGPDAWNLEAHMLGRSANDLFWMSRYIERAENIARLLEVGYRIALLPREGDGQDERVAVDAAQRRLREGLPRQVRRLRHARRRQLHAVRCRQPIERLLQPRHGAAQRARPAHGADARDVGEPQQRLARILRRSTAPRRLLQRAAPLFDWIKERSALFRGTLLNTILRNDTFYFNQLGTFLERADNTARILDVKYYVPAAPQRDRRRRDRQRAVGGHPALGVGAPQLPLGLQGQLQALADRRLPDPQPADAALAAVPATRRWCPALDELGGFYGSRNGCQSARARDAAPAGGGRHERHLPIRPARVPGRVHRPQQPPRPQRSPPRTTSPTDDRDRRTSRPC